MSGERVLCVIPARGGSKGVPRKNLRPIGGRPLLAWVCDVARQTPLIDCTVLSTDDPEMAAVARSHGVEAPFLRDAALGRDETPVIEVVRDALTRMEIARGVTFVPVVQWFAQYISIRQFFGGLFASIGTLINPVRDRLVVQVESSMCVAGKTES